jgi:hypothetical protein
MSKPLATVDLLEDEPKSKKSKISCEIEPDEKKEKVKYFTVSLWIKKPYTRKETKQELIARIEKFGVDFSDCTDDYDEFVFSDFELFQVCLSKHPNLCFWRFVLTPQPTLQKDLYFKCLKQELTMKVLKASWAFVMNAHPTSTSLLNELNLITDEFVQNRLQLVLPYLFKDLSVLVIDYMESFPLINLLQMLDHQFDFDKEKQLLIPKPNYFLEFPNFELSLKTFPFQTTNIFSSFDSNSFKNFQKEISPLVKCEFKKFQNEISPRSKNNNSEFNSSSSFVASSSTTFVSSSSLFCYFASSFYSLEKDPLDMPPPIQIDWTGILPIGIKFPEITNATHLITHCNFLFTHFSNFLITDGEDECLVYIDKSDFGAFGYKLHFDDQGQILCHHSRLTPYLIAKSFEAFMFRCYLIYWSNNADLLPKDTLPAIAAYKNWLQKVSERKKNNCGFVVEL